VAETARGPELSELETFLLAVEEGSIARASVRLRISAPAAAKRIRQLETLAHAPLLDRGRRGVTPTDAGKRLYPIARELVSRRGEAVAALRGDRPADPIAAAGLGEGRQAAAPAPREMASAIGDLSERYLQALRESNAKLALAIADEALDAGADIATIHSQLIGPAMKTIGELWERDVISVADEHLATEISERVAARVFWRALNGRPRRCERVVMAAIQGEQHALGLRLAADVLDSAGFDVLYLGANLPLTALLQTCRAHRPNVLGLTVSMPLNIPTLAWEVSQIRMLECPPRVMIGGRVAETAVRNGLSATVVPRSDQVLEVIESVLRGDAEPIGHV
jgi:MerR family transcriptional regulator, light-induced transcriptional regulator